MFKKMNFVWKMASILSRPQCLEVQKEKLRMRYYVCSEQLHVFFHLCCLNVDSILTPPRHGNTLGITGPLCRESTVHTRDSSHRGPVMWSFDVFIVVDQNKRCWTKSQSTADLRRLNAHMWRISKITIKVYNHYYIKANQQLSQTHILQHLDASDHRKKLLHDKLLVEYTI